MLVEEQKQVEDEKKENMECIAKGQSEKMAALGQLAGGIAHDFNNQLMSIIGNATMIQKTDDLTKIREYAERIIHISQSTSKLTKKILMFSRKESSTNKPINLKSVIDNTCYMVESIISKQIEMNYSYGASKKLILGDESQIESLIVNLILNAKDAVDNSFSKIQVGTEDTVVFEYTPLSHGEILAPGEYIKIYVKDNGIGISEGVFNRIFEPYFTTKNKVKGTGLGLSVVFGTVKSHRGYINVISKINSGTTFEIFLPVYTNNENKPKEDSIKVDGNYIMLVDDDINVLDVEAEMIEDIGYDVIKFDKPLLALEYFNENYKKIAFLIIDISMPIISGKKLFEKMLKINPDATAIFITGYAMQADYEELAKKGHIIIEKPFTSEDLSTHIAKLY